MNNESTQTLQLDDLRISSGDIQHFVDQLVHAYEERALNAKTVQVEHVDRALVPTLNLDATDVQPSEEDIMSARIFPTQDHEKIKEEMYREIDAAVENYANMIIAQSNKFFEYLLRIYACVFFASVQLYTHICVFGIKIISRIRTSFTRDAVEMPAVTGHALTPVFEVRTIAENDTLTYSYQSFREPQHLKTFTPMLTVAIPFPRTLSEVESEPSQEDSTCWNHVAHSLYLQFRYGPKNLR